MSRQEALEIVRLFLTNDVTWTELLDVETELYKKAINVLLDEQ